jgi:hypothetical protein
VHHRNNQEASQRQHRTEEHHRDQDAHRRQEGANRLHQPLADDLIERLHTVHQAGHDVAGLLAVEIGQRQRLHLVEDCRARVAQEPLTGLSHQVGLPGLRQVAGP